MALNRPFALYKMLGGKKKGKDIGTSHLLYVSSEKCNFNATEVNQEIIAKEKVQKAKPVR